jgi:hypothetical protein
VKKLILLLSLSFLFSKDISGDYIVTTITENGKTKHPNAEVSFKKDGKYYMMGAPFGQWKSGKGKIVYINTAFEPKFEKFSVKYSNNKMILQNSKGKMVYKKIDKQKANAKNSNSFLVGSWIYSNKNYSEKIIFKKPDSFECIEQDKANNTTTKASGKWLYNNNNLTVTAFGCNINGRYNIKKDKNALIIGDERYMKVE